MGVIPSSLVPWLTAGHSILVATRDAALVPEGARAVGLVVAADRARVTVFMAEASAGRTVANCAVAPVLALTVSEPPTHRTVQLKGTVRAVRRAADEERAVLDDYRERLAGSLAYVGLARGLTRRMANWPAWAIEVEVTALYEQTPGPGAGAPLARPA